MLAYILTFILTFGPTWPITTEPHLLKSFPRFLATRSFFSGSLRWGLGLREFEPVTLLGGWRRRATCRVDGSEERTCMSLCDFFSFHVCKHIIYIYLVLPASMAYNYNYRMAGRIKTCKRIEMGALTFDICLKNNHTVWRLNEHKIWGKQRVL